MVDTPIRCPNCGTVNSAFARFMNLSRCRQCGHDLELIEVSEALQQGITLHGATSLYRYAVGLEGATFDPQGVLLAPPLELDPEDRRLRIAGDLEAAPGVSMLWRRVKGERAQIPFDRVEQITLTYHLEKLAREDHAYQHHWDIDLLLVDGRQIALGRITAERHFPGPVRSHHHALRLAHALHELTGWPVQQREREERP